MPIVIAFANMKGGVGKTTLCVNLAFEVLASRSQRVLLVDNDPQSNATTALVRPKEYIEEWLEGGSKLTIYDIYEQPHRKKRKAKKKLDPGKLFMRRWSLVDQPDTSLDLIASRLELHETLRNPSQKEYLVDKFLTRYAASYDYIFIDCPPTPSVLTLSAFAASDYVLIPVTPDNFAALGLPAFLAILNDFKDDMVDRHDIRPLGMVFTNVPRRHTADVEQARIRVRETLEGIPGAPPIFSAELSHWSALQKVLWQSVPIQHMSGTGQRGKTEAIQELRAILSEIEERIAG